MSGGGGWREHLQLKVGLDQPFELRSRNSVQRNSQSQRGIQSHLSYTVSSWADEAADIAYLKRTHPRFFFVGGNFFATGRSSVPQFQTYRQLNQRYQGWISLPEPRHTVCACWSIWSNIPVYRIPRWEITWNGFLMVSSAQRERWSWHTLRIADSPLRTWWIQWDNGEKRREEKRKIEMWKREGEREQARTQSTSGVWSEWLNIIWYHLITFNPKWLYWREWFQSSCVCWFWIPI